MIGLKRLKNLLKKSKSNLLRKIAQISFRNILEKRDKPKIFLFVKQSLFLVPLKVQEIMTLSNILSFLFKLQLFSLSINQSKGSQQLSSKL